MSFWNWIASIFKPKPPVVVVPVVPPVVPVSPPVAAPAPTVALAGMTLVILDGQPAYLDAHGNFYKPNGQLIGGSTVTAPLPPVAPAPVVIPPVIPVVVPPSNPQDKVLLVGINKYPTMPLKGCVNDVVNVKEYLIKNLGFLESNIVTLLDEQATTKNILEKLYWLANSAPGSRVYFHYSGHGARNPIGRVMHEIICPVDFDWSDEHMIMDSQFVKIFETMPSGVLFNWGSDSCNSGGLERSFKGTSKNFPAPPEIAEKIAELTREGVRSKGMIGGKLDVGFISGCRGDQTSADTVENGQNCGAFTHFMLKQMRLNPLAISCTDLTVLINRDLRANGYDQQPVCAGARANLPFLA